MLSDHQTWVWLQEECRVYCADWLFKESVWVEDEGETERVEVQVVSLLLLVGEVERK